MAHASWGDDEIQPLGVTLSINSGEATVVVVGELDVFSVPRLRDALRQAYRRRVARVVVDLAGVSFIDVVGLNLLVAVAADCREHGTGFALRDPSDEVIRIRELLGLDDTALPVEQ